ncbi:MAG: hypothetical protein WCI92_17080 [Bacteroidota bacterium]
MTLNRLTRDADDLIRKVVSRYNQIYIPTGSISQIELDLMLDDIRKLYDTFKSIGQINLTMQNEVKKPEVMVNAAVSKEPSHAVYSTPLYDKQASPTPEAEALSAPAEAEPKYYTAAEPDNEWKSNTEPELTFNSESSPISDPVFDNQTPEEEIFQPVPENAENDAFTQANSEKEISSVNSDRMAATMADKFNTGNKSLSETIASSPTQGTMGSHLFYHPLTDLSAGIGFNDKFLFISDLFGDNIKQYEEAITRINKAVNQDEAMWILQKYHVAEWDQKQETIARLKSFILRRFV